MSFAIITPRKALSSILAVLILAQKGSTGAVAACHVPDQIPSPVEAWGMAVKDVASKITAVGLEMFTFWKSTSRVGKDYYYKTYASSHRRTKDFEHPALGHGSGSGRSDKWPLGFLLRCGGPDPQDSELLDWSAAARFPIGIGFRE